MPENQIFISYRRSDTDADANALYQTLAMPFGDEAIFKDVDNIPLGSNFRTVISQALACTDVMLVLIGPLWPSTPDGATLLDSEDDFVRIELEAAIGAGIPMVPILLRGAQMPSPEQLPENCRDLAYLNAADVEHRSWRRDIVPVVEAVGRYLRSADEARSPAADRGEDRTTTDGSARLGLLTSPERRGYAGAGRPAPRGPLTRLGPPRPRRVPGPRLSSRSSARPRADGASKRTPRKAVLVSLVLIGAVGITAALAWRTLENAPGTPDDSSSEVVGIEVGDAPGTPLVRSDGEIWVANRDSADVSVIDGASYEVVATLPVGRVDVGMGQGFGKVWVPDSSAGGISVVDPASRDVIGRVQVAQASIQMAFTSGRVWLAQGGLDRVAVIDGNSYTVTSTIPVGDFPGRPLVARDKVWVQNRDSDDVSVIDTALNRVVATVPVGEFPGRPVVAGGKIWLTNRDSDDVTVIDAANYTVSTTIPVGDSPSWAVVAQDKVWVPNTASDTVSVIDVQSATVVDEVEVGDTPRWPVVANGRVFVPNFGSQDISVIDANTGTVVETIPVGESFGPPGVLAASVAHVWVPRRGSDDIIAIDADTLDVVDP